MLVILSGLGRLVLWVIQPCGLAPGFIRIFTQNPQKFDRLAVLRRGASGASFRTISLVGLVKNDIVAQILKFRGVVLCNIVLTVAFAFVYWFCSVLPTSGQT
jgi:hypothetical protein